MNDKPSFLKRLFSFSFSMFNTLRKVIINLVFFSVLIIFVVALTTNDDEVNIPQSAALVLDLRGDIVEQKKEIAPIDAFMSEAMGQQEDTPEILMADIVRVIKKAEQDDRIKLLVLKLQNMQGAGLTKLRDIAKVLEIFKASGKEVIALGDQYTQDQYYLASYANDVWLDPNGWMLLDGYGRYQLYFKSALDKLSISQHIFRVGTYKSAVEPYMRDDMSEAAKEANKLWLNDLWQQYKEDVAKQREFAITNFDETTDGLLSKLKLANGNIAEYALNNNWVDQLKTREQMNATLIEKVGKASSGNSFSHVSFKDYLKAITPALPMNNPVTDKVAVIVAKGTILNGTQKPGTIGGDSTAKLLRKARNNDKVKAVVLRVDSPGGSAYASEIIRQEVELLKDAGKPVVASMGTYAASGGYWISAPANKIIASPTTITGSIGIFGFFMTFENSLSKLGIHTDGVGTTEVAGFGVTRPLSEGMAELFQISIERGYRDFINLVAENRNMTAENVDKIAQGRVWSGMKAKEIGLVDELGDLDYAVKAAAEIAGLDHYDTLLIEKELSAKDIFLRNMLGGAAEVLSPLPITTAGPVEKMLATIKTELMQLNQLNDPQGIYSICLSCELN